MKDVKENTVKAENQVNTNENVFYLGKGGIKILILGNSITRHGICPEIGWYGLYGMAASNIDRDYVHLLKTFFEKDGIDVYFMVRQESDLEVALREKRFNDFDLSRYNAVRDFGADIIIFRLGENINGLDVEYQSVLKEQICKTLEYMDPQGHSSIIFTTRFWKDEVVDGVIRCIAATKRQKLVELGDLGEDTTMKAAGLFEHIGVAAHPGDKGMEQIAARIYGAIKEILKEKV